MIEAARADLREADLESIMTAFYDTLGTDPLVGPYFAPVDMRAHIPRIVDFWSTMVFDTAAYGGNAFRPHQKLPGLTAEHFGRWLNILESTVDARVAGPSADRMKALAHRIAYSMQVRLKIDPVLPWRAEL